MFDSVRRARRESSWRPGQALGQVLKHGRLCKKRGVNCADAGDSTLLRRGVSPLRALAFHFWRTRWRGASVPRVAPWERAAILAPFALHTWLVYDMLWAHSELRFGSGRRSR